MSAARKTERLDAEATWRLGLELANQGKHAEAIEQYRKATELKLDFPDAYLSWGAALANLNKHAEAIEKYRKTIEIRPDYPLAYCNWGLALAAMGRHAEAVEKHVKATELNADYADAHQYCGAALANQGKYAEAIEKYRKAIELNPNHADAHQNWGAALANQAKHAEAIEKYRKAIELKPDFPLAYSNWGLALAAMGRHAEAVEKYVKATELKPDYADAHQFWGAALANQGKYAEAIEKYRKAIELKPDYAVAYCHWGLALTNSGKHDEAIEQYRKAIELKPDYVLAYHSWGVALAGLGKHDGAIEQYRKAADLKPDSTVAFHYWGLALSNLGRHDEAIERYRKAVEVQPDYALAYYDWGIALGNLGKHSEAIEQYTRATELNPDYTYAYHNLAYSLGVQGRYDEGRAAWDAALRAYQRAEPASKSARDADFFSYYGGVVHSVRGNLDEAERILKEGLSIAPDHVGALINLGRLHKERHDEPIREGEAPGEKTVSYWASRDCSRRAERALKQRLLQSEDYRSLQALGDLYLEMEDYDQAKAHLEKALKKDIEAAAAHNGLGVICSRKEEYRQAARHFEDAHRRDAYDLAIWSNLAEAYHNLKMTDKAEAEFRKILKIANDHIDSQVGLGEVYTALGDGGETEYYEFAIRHYTTAIDLGRTQRGSKRLRAKELAALHYSRGYARTKLYEASRLHADESQLDGALEDFNRCCVDDPDHHKADRARVKLKQRLRRFSTNWFTEKIGPWLILVPSLFVLGFTQLSFFFEKPKLAKPLEVTSYVILTFGALIFVVVGLFLPQIQKIKGAGIEIEKGAVTQITTSASLGIMK